jgi:PKD repeat protein
VTATFTDTSTSLNCGITSWLWTFGDGTPSTERNPPPHLYLVSNAEKSYTVTLTVTNALHSNTLGGVQVQVK